MDINWSAVSAIFTVLLTLGAGANYMMLQSIRVSITELKGELKEWARDTFASDDRVTALEGRVAHLEQSGKTG